MDQKPTLPNSSSTLWILRFHSVFSLFVYIPYGQSFMDQKPTLPNFNSTWNTRTPLNRVSRWRVLWCSMGKQIRFILSICIPVKYPTHYSPTQSSQWLLF